MKARVMTLGVLMILSSATMAATRYVVPSGGGHVPNFPYTSWADAATNLQTAVAVTEPGDIVLVTNGTHYLTEQVTVTNITVRSYNNGAIDRAGTIVNANNYAGKPVTNRCFLITHSGGVVEGFTITNGYMAFPSLVAGNGGGGVHMTAGTLRDCVVAGNLVTNGYGGGIYAVGSSCVVTNCDVIGNQLMTSGSAGGGGIYMGSSAQVVNCRLLYNTAPIYYCSGGGICSAGGLIANCLLVSNTVPDGYGAGGIWVAGATTIRNCLITGSDDGRANVGAGIGCHGSSAVIENCTIVGNFGQGIGAGNASVFRVANTISYYNTGEAMFPGGSGSGTLIASNCCMTSTGYVDVGSANTTLPPSFMNQAGGDYRLWPWSVGVDAGMELDWLATATDLEGEPRVNGTVDMGAYETAAEAAPVHYVARNGQTPVSPYTNGWGSAASNIQEAVAVAKEGAIVVVTNGVYPLTNEVIVGNLTVRSYNGGATDRIGTIIDGANYAGKPVTNRCFTLDNPGAVVDGFTLTNGYVLGVSGIGGAGAYIKAGTLRDCLVTGNVATNGSGGGVYASGTVSVVFNCDIVGNLCAYSTDGSRGGGGVKLTLGAQLLNSRVLYNDCARYYSAGGGVHIDGGSLVLNCIIASNTLGKGYAMGTANTHGYGGGGVWFNGANAGAVRNCVIYGNAPGAYSDKGAGVGSVGGSVDIQNCTVLRNYGTGLGAGVGNGVSVAYRVVNSISYYNNGVDMFPGSNTTTSTAGTLIASNCCASSFDYMTTGSGNITAVPLFMQYESHDYRLTPWSPGVDAGLSLGWMSSATDLAGGARIGTNGLVDMGAYETSVGGPAPTYYVAQAGQTPVSPYTNGWASAASNLQDAVAVISDGCTLLASNGVYVLDGQLTVHNFTLRSYRDGVVAPDGVIVDGNYPNVTNRCFVLTNAYAVVDGFTITNGYVAAPSLVDTEGGGGVYMYAGTLRNCTVIGNTVTNANGGGIYAIGAGCLITNCRVIANVNYYADGANPGRGGGGGMKLVNGPQVWNTLIAHNRTPWYCNCGGGVQILGSGALLANCGIVSNSIGDGWAAGGVWIGGTSNTLRNCLIVGNDDGRQNYTAGVGAGNNLTNYIDNCTVVSNFGRGIGPYRNNATDGTTYRVVNTIHYYNTFDAMYAGGTGTMVALNCCVSVTNGIPDFDATGNITNAPGFVNAAAGNYRLKHTSPCLNAGLNQDWMTGALDLDGNVRISPLINGTVDIGAYEFPLAQGSVFMMR